MYKQEDVIQDVPDHATTEHYYSMLLTKLQKLITKPKCYYLVITRFMQQVNDKT